MFKEYETTYDKINKQDDVEAILKPYTKKGSFDAGDEELKKALMDYILVYSQYPTEVSFFATKFLNAADLFLNSCDRKLPDNISSDYIRLKKTEYKPNFSVEKGKFVRNRDAMLPEIPDEQLQGLFEFVKGQLKD
jgi:hypothetical protein